MTKQSKMDNSLHQVEQALPNLDEATLRKVVQLACQRMTQGGRNEIAIDQFVGAFPKLADDKKLNVFSQIGVVPIHHGSLATGLKFPKKIPMVGRLISEISKIGSSIQYVNDMVGQGVFPYGNPELTDALRSDAFTNTKRDDEGNCVGEPGMVDKIVELIEAQSEKIQKGIKSARPAPRRRTNKKPAAKKAPAKKTAKTAPKKTTTKKADSKATANAASKDVPPTTAAEISATA